MAVTWRAGAAAVDISPRQSQFLFGYPFVKRWSTGVHDPLLASALYLADGRGEALIVANDIIFVPQSSVRRLRRQISLRTGVPEAAIMISATHTHSGPMTVDYISNAADPVVPPTDPEYVSFMEAGIVEAAAQARASSGPARLGFTVADSTGVGTNRRDPAGPADHRMPVLVVQDAAGSRTLACMLVCSMHPTVLHEDSTLVSGDFLGLARQYLQNRVFAPDTVVLCHMGPAGNQSPRHVTKANTFAEAERLGGIVGRAVATALPKAGWNADAGLAVAQRFVDLPRRRFPAVAEAEARLAAAVGRLEDLRRQQAPRQQIRTAECDWFGACETLELAKAAVDGRLEAAYSRILPAEVQVVAVGGHAFAGWPAEVFVDYALEVKRRNPDACVISLANGELQGYIVTAEAAREGGYEASNSLFDHRAGDILVATTLEMLGNLGAA